MALFSFLSRKEKSFSLKNPSPMEQWIRDIFQTSPGDVSKPFEQAVWVYRAVLIWLRIAQVPLILKDERGELVERDALSFLIDSPNTQEDISEIIEQTVLELAMHGTAFIVKGDGEPTKSIPQFISVWPTKAFARLQDSDLDNLGRALRYRVRQKNKGERLIDITGLVRVRLPNPYDKNFGLSPLESIKLSVNADVSARTHNRHMMKNHGRVANIIGLGEDVNQKAVDDFQKRWEAKYKGSENAGKDAIVSGAPSVNQLSMSMKDLDWLEGMKLTREEICAGFGIPPNMAGILDKATYSNYEQAAKSLWIETLIPLGEKITKAINRQLIRSAGRMHKISFDWQTVDALQENEKDRVSRYIELVRGGKVTPIAAAKIAGIDIGDEHPAHKHVWIGISETTYDDYEMPPEPTPGPPPGPPPEPQTREPKFIEVPVEKIVRVTRGVDIVMQQRGKAILSKADKYEAQAKRRLKRYFYDQRVEVLANAQLLREKIKIYKAVESKAIIETPEEMAIQLLGRKDWNKELRKVQPIFIEAMRSGAMQILSEIGAATDRIDDAILQSLIKDQATLLNRVNETTRNELTRVMETFRKNAAGEMTEAQILDAVNTDLKTVFNNTESRRVTIARTESLRGLNGGRFAQMSAARVDKKEWLTIIDGETRQSHIDMNGERKPIGELFSNGLMYPHDPGGNPVNGPGETINCRCTLLSIYED